MLWWRITTWSVRPLRVDMSLELAPGMEGAPTTVGRARLPVALPQMSPTLDFLSSNCLLMEDSSVFAGTSEANTQP